MNLCYVVHLKFTNAIYCTGFKRFLTDVVSQIKQKLHYCCLICPEFIRYQVFFSIFYKDFSWPGYLLCMIDGL